MPAILNPKLTDAGKAAAVNAKANGLQLQITHIALGTGQYDSATTGAAKTQMVGRKEQVLIGSGVVTGTGGFRINVLFNGWTGSPSTYNATEIGFYAGDPAAGGVLFAVYSHPSDVIVQRNSLKYIGSFNLQITDVPAESITVVIDPDAAQSLVLIALHEGASNPHPGYVRKSGDTSTGAQLGVTAPQNEPTKAFATTEWVKRSGLTFPASGGLGIDATATLTDADMGRWGSINTAGATMVLPLSTTVPVGSNFRLVASALYGLVRTQGADLIVGAGIVETKLLQVVQGETLDFTRNQAGNWALTGAGARHPAGAVSFFAGSAPPPGWLKLNGAEVSRASYPTLWAYAQAQGVVSEVDWFNNGYSGRFSVGSAGTNFRLPDARGLFLRSLDEGRGMDGGRAWGTFQDHANRSHAHGISDPGHAHSVFDPGHFHSAYSDVKGQHRHGVPEGVDGAYAFTGNAGVGNDGTAQGMPATGAGFGSRWSAVPVTAAAGEHQHTVYVNPSPANTSMYPATTGVAVQPDGTEARPKNLSFILAVKF